MLIPAQHFSFVRYIFPNFLQKAYLIIHNVKHFERKIYDDNNYSVKETGKANGKYNRLIKIDNTCILITYSFYRSLLRTYHVLGT